MTAHAIPVVSIDGGTGIPGGTVAVLAALAGDSERAAVAADLTVSFPAPPLAIDPGTCTIAARLSGSHRLTADAPAPGELQVTIAPADGPTPLDDGPLATCAASIALGTPAGTAALDLAVTLRNAAGETVPADAVDGVITIESVGPTPTAVDTATPTPTITSTPVPPPTDTPTVTPTATIFRPTFLADQISDCAVVSPGAHDAWPLLALLGLLWLRRRSGGAA